MQLTGASFQAPRKQIWKFPIKFLISCESSTSITLKINWFCFAFEPQIKFNKKNF